MRFFPCLVALLLALPALGGEAEIRQALRAKFPNVRVDGVQPAAVPGLFEVRMQTQEGPQLLYTDGVANFIFDGSIIDLRSGRNLTQDRLQKLSAIEFSSLPLDLALKVQRGNGKRVLAMFTDPYCPYCRRLEQALLQIDDITIYVFMFPVIRPDLADHSRAVWCAPDRVKAWLELAATDKPKAPQGGASCANPVDRVLELGRSLRVRGTPTLFFANGERAGGGMPAGQLRSKLDEIAGLTSAKK
ncbi:MAG: DsbC family protein [Burkholderiales bacterium]|nr:DsbC family protein [Burkholderiales bacterium]